MVAARHGYGGRGGGQGGSSVDLMTKEEERRRILWSVVVGPSPYTGVAVTVGWTRSQWRGPSDGGDGRADGESAAWTR
jgi:hypothetical protein